jgi:hypothetical protein
MMAASYTADAGAFAAAKPRVWARGPVRRGSGTTPGAEDGLSTRTGGGSAVGKSPDVDVTSLPDRATFVFNFFDELRRIAPPGKR